MYHRDGKCSIGMVSRGGGVRVKWTIIEKCPPKGGHLRDKHHVIERSTYCVLYGMKRCM